MPGPLCSGCPLALTGHGFAPMHGPAHAPLLFLGEALGQQEARRGEAFVGPAGMMLNRVMARADIPRESVRIVNCVRCQPPHDWLDGAPWEQEALTHCRQAYLDQDFDTWLAGGGQVIVALGNTALRQALGLQKGRGIQVKDFHGTVNRDPSDRFWVVPTFHPSYLQRGAVNLLDTVRVDLARAREVVEQGWSPVLPSLICDPPLDAFSLWVDDYVAAVTADPRGIWLSVDIETPEKVKGTDEGELQAGVKTDEIITRVNFSCHPDEGVTVPFEGAYRPLVAKALATSGVKVFWGSFYDLPRLRLHHMVVLGPIWDFMWAWHALQTDLPRGLGFVAPFYSDYGAWKHWAHIPGREAEYAAADGFQTLRVAHGIAADLVETGRWRLFEHHMAEVDRRLLKPAEDVGILVDRERLEAFKITLQDAERTLLGTIQGCVPESVCPLTPKQGLKKPPPEGTLHPHARTHTLRGKKKKGKPVDEVKRELYAEAKIVERCVERCVQVCQTCGAQEVSRAHRCGSPESDRTRVLDLALVVRSVTRYFWREPFSPDSPQQVLAYIKTKKHRAGTQKKTRRPTTDRSTLDRLARTTGDPIYQAILDYRAIGKILGTYVNGTLSRLDTENRLHPTFTWRPSTLRSSCVSPNIQNVVTDRDSERGEGATIASGFRRAIVAGSGCKLVECVAPETQILKSDLTWVRADTVQTGDELLSFDEMPKGHAHSFRASVVTQRAIFTRPCVRVVTTHGAIIVATTHPFLARWCKAGRHWVSASNLQPGMRLAFLAEPWNVDESREAGYLAGFFDGEGWIGRVTVGYGQNPGPTLQYVQSLLTARGYDFRESPNNSNSQCEITNGIRPTLRFLGTIRPPRLMRKARQIWEGRRTWGKQSPLCRVVSVESVGEGPVIALETSTKTYISNGFFSHNCDFAGIEAVLVGWFMNDPQYMRLAQLGLHAYVASHDLNRPADLTWSDADLATYFKEIKESQDPLVVESYNRSKRCVHAVAYGITLRGMTEAFPKAFPTQRAAQKTLETYFAIAPRLPQWHEEIRLFGRKHGYWGGPGQHPFGARHHFYAVYAYTRLTQAQYAVLRLRTRRAGVECPVDIINGDPYQRKLGEDARRIIAFPPQSTARFILTEAGLRLTDPDSPSFIGDLYHGQTPIRAIIHDSLLAEVPVQVLDQYIEKVVREMTRPILELPITDVQARQVFGPHLSIGVDVKVGTSWDKHDMVPVEVPAITSSVAGDRTVPAIEPPDEEDLIDLATAVPT